MVWIKWQTNLITSMILCFYLTDFILYTYDDVDIYTCLYIKTENIMWINELFEAFQHETDLYNFAICVAQCYLCMASS